MEVEKPLHNIMRWLFFIILNEDAGEIPTAFPFTRGEAVFICLKK